MPASFLPILAVWVAAPGLGQGPTPVTPVTPLDPVVITASREPRPRDRSPAVVSVISREEIEASGTTQVVDLLRHLAGVHVDQPGARGSRASIYTRGLDPNHTLVLLDGVRLNDPTNSRGGSFDLSALDPVGLERIEIVRGPVSAVHGSGALGGALNLISQRAGDAPMASADLSGGRWDGYRLAASGAGRRGPLDLRLAGAWVDEGDPPGGGRFRAGTLQANLGLKVLSEGELRGHLRFAETRAEAFPDASGGSDRAVRRDREHRDAEDLALRLSFTTPVDDWLETTIDADFRQRRERATSPGVAPGIGNPAGVPASRNRDRLDHAALALRTTARPGGGFSVTVGGDVYREEGSSRASLFLPGPLTTRFDETRWVGGPFAELHWDGPRGLSLYGGSRADFSSEESPQLTPRVGAVQRLPWLGLRLDASWGRGFKLPGFFALANPVVGNPDLDSERSRGFDLGISADLWAGRLTGRLGYFDLEVKDLIDFDPDRFLLVNRSEVDTHGLELELGIRPRDGLAISTHLSWVETDVSGPRDELLNRPRWRGGVVVGWRPLPQLSLRGALLHVGSSPDFAVPTGEQRLDHWTRFDLALHWQRDERLGFQIQIDNVFDSDYEEAIGFPAPGIRPRIGVTWRMR